MQRIDKMNARFIGFMGVPGVGKSSLAEALAKRLGAHVFIEPGEEAWPIDHAKPWEAQVDAIEKWVCDSNREKFTEARRLADEGEISVADAGIFLVNRHLVYADCTDWYYGLMSKAARAAAYQVGLVDWEKAPCPDVLILVETDKQTWVNYVIQRGRRMDSDDKNFQNYDEQKRLFAVAASEFASARGCEFIRFENGMGSVEENASLLSEKIDNLNTSVNQSKRALI